MKVTTTITKGELVEGSEVEGVSVGHNARGREVFRATWAGTFDGIRLDTHDGVEDYAYFRNGHTNGTPQGMHGFPVANLED